MKAIAVIFIVALAGLNIYQFVKIQDLQTDTELAVSAKQGELENAKAPLLTENTRLTKRAEALESTINELENTISELKQAGRPANESTPVEIANDGSGDSTASGLAEMMKNPQIKEMAIAQQTATIDLMYKGLYDQFGLEGEDLEHFKKLLTEGQVSMMELGIDLMNPKLTAEEREAIYDKIAKGQEEHEARVKEFLNDDADFEQFQFYGETLGERMIVSGTQTQLESQNMGLEAAQQENLVRLMKEERDKVPFENQYYDQKKFDPGTLTNDSIDRYMEQHTIYQNNLNARLGEVLSPEQAEVFKQQQEQNTNMQKMGLQMAAGMFGGTEK